MNNDGSRDLLLGAAADYPLSRPGRAYILYSKLAYPGDTDGDGCPDVREHGPIPNTGGVRDYRNPHDYFNPTHDGQNRIDDVLLVRDQYFIDSGDLGYTQDTDRTLLGPNAWNTGAPDGLQRVDDILNMVKQYFHDCS